MYFTDEARATLDGPDGWDSGWVEEGQEADIRIRRQKGGVGVMFWAGIVENILIGPVRLSEDVEVDSKAYCRLLEDVFIPWFKRLPPAKKILLIFQQDHVPPTRPGMAWLKGQPNGKSVVNN